MKHGPDPPTGSYPIRRLGFNPTFDLDRTVPRLFLGLDLPDPIDFDLQLLAGGVPGARWQQADQLHLTLHFIGRFAAAQADLEARAQAVGAAMTAAPVDFVLDHASSFARPRGKAPCVFGVADGAARLADLAARLGAAIASASDDGRPFLPHVTWLYSSDRIVGAYPIAPIAWHAQTVSLAHGIAGESAYRILACWPLMADPPNA